MIEVTEVFAQVACCLGRCFDRGVGCVVCLLLHNATVDGETSFYAAGHTSPCRTSARQGGERSGPCRDVRVTELCEVKGDVTIPELKRQHNDAHDPSDYRPADEDRTVLESCARLSGK